jgi:phage gpG-like protein
MAGVTGDFGALRNLVVTLSGLSTFAEEGKRRLGEEGIRQIHDEFAKSRDPYDRTWKPAFRGGQTLLDTGRLRASFSSQPTAPGFQISTNVKYAAIHQYGGVIRPKKPGGVLVFNLQTGTRFAGRGGRRLKSPKAVQTKVFATSVTMPRRQIVPEGRLGVNWTDGFIRESEAIMRERLAGTR